MATTAGRAVPWPRVRVAVVMPARHKRDVVRAAGAVAWRHGREGPLIALVHRARYDDWSYPKGKLEPGEHALLAAVREVAEEARTQVILGRPLGRARYLADGRPKRVDYWAGRESGPTAVTPGAEVDDVQWLPVAAVRRRLSYQRDIALLDAFLAEAVDTVPFIVLRHASAGSKAVDASDLDRPLDAAGMATAATLAGLLGCFGSLRVHSSQAERCLATVRPYAEAAGTRVLPEPAFTVGGRAAVPPAAAAERAAALAVAGEPVLICAHRENLPVVIGAACRALRSERALDEPLRKGSFLVVQSAAGKLISAERHSP